MSKLVLDVSNVNPLRPGDLKRSGAAGLYAKATEGTGFHDATLQAHRAAAHAAGVPFGSYVFLRVGSAGNEAAAYYDYAMPRAGDLLPVVDSEDDKDIVALAHRTYACLETLERYVGHAPLWYTNVDDALRCIAVEPRLKRFWIWQAQYPAGRVARWLPSLAALRIRLRHGLTVVLWQYTDHYNVNGHAYDASRLLVPLDSLRIPHGI